MVCLMSAVAPEAGATGLAASCTGRVSVSSAVPGWQVRLHAIHVTFALRVTAGTVAGSRVVGTVTGVTKQTSRLRHQTP